MKKVYNKKGENNAIMWGLLVVAIIMVTFVGVYVFQGSSKQETIASGQAAQTIEKLTSVTTGKAATLGVSAFENAGNSRAQNATPSAYVWVGDNENDINEIVKNAGTLSATTTLDVSSGITTGKWAKGIAYATSTTVGFYGEPKVQQMKTESDTMQLETWALIDSSTNGFPIDIDIFDENDALTTTLYYNMTLAAGSDSYTYAKWRITNNQTDRAWNLRGIGIDLVESTNISNIKIGSSDKGAVNEGTRPERIKTTEFFLELETPVLLGEQDTLTLNAITFEGDADGCVTNEDVTLRFLDWAPFLSSSDSTLQFGYEDDSTSNTDVGTGDVTLTISCD